MHTYFIYFFSLFLIFNFFYFLLDSHGPHGSHYDSHDLHGSHYDLHGSHYDSHGSLARMLVKLDSLTAQKFNECQHSFDISFYFTDIHKRRSGGPTLVKGSPL